jgi:SAM-dependent methyltransferase
VFASLQWASGLGKGQAFDVGSPSATLISALSSMGPPLESDLTALVPGCGRAYDALALARHGYAKVVAVDLSQTACEAALEELQSSGDPAAAKVEVVCADYFQLGDAHRAGYDLIWDCTFLCALDPSVREQWATQQRALLSARGTLLACVFPLCEKVGGPPYAMSVPLVRNLLEPVGFRATTTREDLTEAECHRPGSMSAPFPGTALVAFRVGAA